MSGHTSWREVRASLDLDEAAVAAARQRIEAEQRQYEHLRGRAETMRAHITSLAQSRGWRADLVAEANAALDALDFQALDRVLGRLDR